MRDFSMNYLQCVNCNNCGNKYPIILKIPILYSNLTSYLSNRSQLGGYLMSRAKNIKLKSFIKNSLKKITVPFIDVIPLEKRWVITYKNSTRSKFYSRIQNSLIKLSKSNLVLEYGCSIGHFTKYLATKHDIAFGID